MTQYTSFVAVDDAIRNRSGKWTTVEQPVELPESVSEKSQPDYRYAGGGGRGSCTSLRGSLGMVHRSAGSATQSYSNGGFATGIDAIISGTGGLGNGGSGSGLNLQKRGSLKISAPEFLKGGALTGGRSKASVIRVVMQNLASLRYSYNKRLRDVPGLNGKISIKFKIDHNGTVIKCEMISSTMNDTILENQIVGKIKRWQFEAIDIVGDITEVVYPFVFSM